MKKAIYISFHDISGKDGVVKKIKSQVQSLSKYIPCVEQTFRTLTSNNLCTEKNNVLNLVEKQKTGRKDIQKVYSELNKQKKYYDYTYIRYEGTTFSKLHYLKNVKKNGGKIVIEVPTYPYKGEKNRITYYIKEFYNYFLKGNVDYVVTFSEEKEIWGIPCINISNGIDLENTKLVNQEKDNVLTFTSVSICATWHGIDRFLNSLEQFKKENPDVAVKFNIVGEGSETAKLKSIVENSQYLKGVVVFHGFKSGQELDDIYNETDIGVGCLGNHRKGIYTIQALKNKEYAAKGLPMIFSEDDPSLRGKEYVYRASHDEELIDIVDVVNWYEKLTITPEEIRESITEFSWEHQIKKVIDVLESRK